MQNKAALRNTLKQRRSNLSTPDKKRFTERINHHLIEFILSREGSVGLYYPINDEIDILPTIARLAHNNIKTALPCTVEAGDPLLYFAWKPEESLLKNKQYDTYEPLMDAENFAPDIIVVPMLGFDASKNRIGYGKGFYDRTLKHFASAVSVGISYEVQRVNSIPIEPHDQPLQFIITESGVF